MFREVLPTTTDNPYDPFTNFEEWLAFDHSQGYNTNEYLARAAATSHELSAEDNEMMIEVAVDEMIALDLLSEIGVHYKKVVRETKES